MNSIPQIWGILNVTPDSFSDGGKFTEVDSALIQAHKMIEAGAHVIDIGGESTRPGAAKISIEEEISRVEIIVKELVKADVVVSLDTMKSEVALMGIQNGVQIINDVSGGLADTRMFETVANSECDYVLMHWRGHSDVMDSLTKYDNVVEEVISEWQKQKELAVRQGIKSERIILDPGLGFAKESQHNWQILANLPEFSKTEHRVLIGASRKRFLAPVAPFESVESRDIPTAQISGWCAQHDIYAVRVHDVATTLSAIKTVKEIAEHVQ